jgi:hypothetical protein
VGDALWWIKQKFKGSRWCGKLCAIYIIISKANECIAKEKNGNINSKKWIGKRKVIKTLSLNREFQYIRRKCLIK